MRHIKKLLSAITALALVLSMSGCYWKGNTKHHSEQLILNALEEKYNEEFFIREIAVRSSYPGRPLAAYCSPKEDEELIFEVQYQEYEYDDPKLLDTYIQSIVRREMKEQIDNVLNEYYDNYACEVYVWGLAPDFDSGIKNADEASIVAYTEAIPETNESHIWIAVDKDEVNDIYNIEEINMILNQASKNFHYSTISIDYYIVSNEIVGECSSEINNNYDITNMATVLSEGKCISDYNNYIIMHGYRYLGESIGLDYVLTVNQNGSYTIK